MDLGAIWKLYVRRTFLFKSGYSKLVTLLNWGLEEVNTERDGRLATTEWIDNPKNLAGRTNHCPLLKLDSPVK